MFLPSDASQKEQEDEEEKVRRAAYVKVEAWVLAAIPKELRTTTATTTTTGSDAQHVQISVQEVQCGDPNCAPIDTSITILFPSGGSGMMGLPMTAKEVTNDEIQHAFPTTSVLEAWHKGEEAEWPPEPDMDSYNVNGEQMQLPKLRFEIGQKVKCRVGPDEVTGWIKGQIIQLWYSEPNWPPNSWAPYKVKLDDGRDIFAPGDMDQVIKKDE